jgi:1,4-dihydroxy-2-naphthoate polyprenyltransferase
VLVGKHIDQADFDRAHHIYTLPVILGDAVSRWFEILLIAAMYLCIGAAVVMRALPWMTLLVLVNLPQGWRAIRVLAAPRPEGPPTGYVGWPLWYHRVGLRHNRSFGWLYILGLALAVIYQRLM